MATQKRSNNSAFPQESPLPITRVALYARVSTLNNQDPEMQLAELREYAGRRGWEIVEEFTDQGVSGCAVPKRLHTTMAAEDSRRTLAVSDHRIIDELGGAEVLFEEVFVELEKQLPAQTNLSIGRDPLICITPLLAKEHGCLNPVTSPDGVPKIPS